VVFGIVVEWPGMRHALAIVEQTSEALRRIAWVVPALIVTRVDIDTELQKPPSELELSFARRM